MIRSEVELPLRAFTQHFKLGKVVGYTHPHKRVACIFSRVVHKNTTLKCKFANLVLREMIAYEKKLKDLKTPPSKQSPFLNKNGLFFYRHNG